MDDDVAPYQIALTSYTEHTEFHMLLTPAEAKTVSHVAALAHLSAGPMGPTLSINKVTKGA